MEENFDFRMVFLPRKLVFLESGKYPTNSKVFCFMFYVLYTIQAKFQKDTYNAFWNWNFCHPKHHFFIRPNLKCILHILSVIHFLRNFIDSLANCRKMPPRVFVQKSSPTFVSHLQDRSSKIYLQFYRISSHIFYSGRLLFFVKFEWIYQSRVSFSCFFVPSLRSVCAMRSFICILFLFRCFIWTPHLPYT